MGGLDRGSDGRASGAQDETTEVVLAGRRGGGRAGRPAAADGVAVVGVDRLATGRRGVALHGLLLVDDDDAATVTELLATLAPELLLELRHDDPTSVGNNQSP